MRVIGFCLKALMAIAIIFAVISYVNYLQTGRFWVPAFSLQNVTNPFKSLKAAPVMQPLEKPEEPIYKWREQGEWVYGDNPPSGINAQLINEEK